MKTEKIQTNTAPQAIGPYSQAISCGNMVFTSGQIAINSQTGNIEASDVKGQTEQVMKNLIEILKAAGASADSVVKTTCYLTNIADFPAFNEVYGTYFTSMPARSCVAVQALPKNALVEVDVVAIKE